MTGSSIVWAPWLPPWLLLGMAVVAAALLAFGLWRRARGIGFRALFLGLLLLPLAGPSLYREERDPLGNIVLLVADRSPSQRLDLRPQQTEKALEDLRTRLSRLPGVELREVTVRGDGREGTPIFSRLRDALGEVERSRLAGVVVVTDGQVHDRPEKVSGWPEEVPLQVLLTGRPDESDRALSIEAAPTFAVVGEPQELVLRVTEQPPLPERRPLRLLVRRDGEVIADTRIIADTSTRIPFTLEKAGRTVLEAEVETRPGELTTLNNRQTLFVNGVRDRLRVLLVSGLPYPGLRVWRNLLKADPSVDLVHFTILRPPEKQDGTPIRELALIAFPTRELFELKLGEFDLVIFDRYARRGLLPLVYLDNIARYVEEGGALLEAAGPEFGSLLSLYRTPLARVLPGRPTGKVLEQGFRPQLTALGRRHPVTRGLAGAAADEPRWGRWFRQIEVETKAGEVVMTGIDGRPLLVLQRVGEGRVAQLLSDQAWLWARGFEGGGPQSLLLRRLVHWLMREPELEEEALIARPVEGGIEIERRSLAAEPVELVVESPSGERRTVTLRPDEDGIARTRIAAEEEGLYRIGDGERMAFAAPRPIAARELENMLSTPEILAPLAEATGGTVVRLSAAGTPDVRLVGSRRRAFGRGWIGLRDRERYVVRATSRTPLLPAPLALLLLLATAALAWWREGRV
ncbi:MAG TPA: hypothetical protein ENJ38_08735 [Rhodospirillales bacterium]|nr:hypothetical protein [Rhodospirillales bacterium]